MNEKVIDVISSLVFPITVFFSSWIIFFEYTISGQSKFFLLVVLWFCVSSFMFWLGTKKQRKNSPVNIFNFEKQRELAETQTFGGSVYLLENSGWYKIGKTSRLVSERVREMNTPNITNIVHTFFSLEYGRAEKELHGLYREYRGKGEWFNLPDEVVENIKKINNYENGEFCYE